MKMTRSKLKGIVKECLVEILAEGIGSTGALNEAASLSTRKRDESLRVENERLANHRKSLDKKIDQTVSNLTEDSIMRDILADTARTTLQEQIKHEGGSGGMAADDPGINLNNIFSESSQMWSQLAFSEKKRS